MTGLARRIGGAELEVTIADMTTRRWRYRQRRKLVASRRGRHRGRPFCGGLDV